jgi:adenosylcobinamide-phosphate synthase
VTALGLLAGWGADLALGDPRRWHPVAAFGSAAAWLERRCWADRRAAGVAYTAVCVGAPTIAVWLLDRRLRSPAARAALLAAVTWAALGGRSLGREAAAIAAAVEAGDIASARRLLPALVGRDPSALDSAAITRAVVESVAENTVDAAVAPLLWGALAGPAGVVAYRCGNTLDAMVGHRNPRYERFGWSAARLDDLMNWVPARVGAVLAACCAPLVGGSAPRALATWQRDGGKHPSPNAGQVEAAFAGALGVRLGGVNRYGDRVETRGPLGSGPRPDVGTVGRAVRLSALVTTVAAILAATGRAGRSGAGRNGRDDASRSGAGRSGAGRDGAGRDGAGRDGARRDGARRDGAGRDGTGR